MRGIFPQIITKKISLRASYDPEIKIEFALRSSANMFRTLEFLQSRSYRWWNDSEPVTRKIKVYFMILTESDYQNISGALYTDNGARLPPLIRNIKRDNYLNLIRRGAFIEVPLEEILRSDAQSTRNASSADTSSPGTRAPGPPQDSTGDSQIRMDSEIYTSVVMKYHPQGASSWDAADEKRPIDFGHRPIPQTALPGDYASMPTDKLHLVSFLGIEVLAEDIFINPNIPDHAGSYAGVSNMGEATYDLLLQRGSSGELEIPSFRDVLFFDDPITRPDLRGSLFSLKEGLFPPEHVTSFIRRNPDLNRPNRELPPYTGWISRLAGNPTPRAIALSSRRVRNYKIFSDTLRRSSSPSPAPVGTGFPPGPTGEEISAFVNSIMNLEEIRDDQLKVRKLVESSIASMGRNIVNIVDWGTAETSHINLVFDPRAPTGAHLQESHYGCVIGINFLDLIKYNTAFGQLIDLHFKQVNEAGERTNLDIVNEILLYSYIVNLRITRQRIKPLPDQFNNQDTKIYSKFEKNQIDKCLIFSSDVNPSERAPRRPPHNPLSPVSPALLRHRLRPMRSADASIEEVEVVPSPTSPSSFKVEQYSRQFVVRDYDLFHNVSYGKYTYVIDITFKDGTREVIRNVIRRYDRNLKNFEKYLDLAAIPVIRNPQTGEYISGNFDYLINQPRRNFSNTNDHDITISEMVESYSMMIRFITGRGLTVQRVDEIKSRLSPRNLKIEIAEEFRSITNELRTSLGEFLNLTTKPRLEKTPGLGTGGEVFVPNASGVLKEVVDLSAKTNIISDAFSSTQLLSDFVPARYPHRGRIVPHSQILDLLPEDRLREFLFESPGEIPGALELVPSRVLRINSAGYDDAHRGFQMYPVDNMRSLRSAAQQISKNRIFNSEESWDELIDFSGYNSLSSFSKADINTEINASRIPDVGLTGANFKPASYFSNQMQISHFGSLSMNIISHGLNRDIHRGNSYDLPQWVWLSMPDLSEETKSSICLAAGRSINKRDFFNQLENTLDDINLLKNSLGSFYDIFNSSIATVDVLIESDLSRIYRDGPTSPQNTSVSVDVNNPFERERACAYSCAPGFEKTKIGIDSFHLTTKLSSRNSKKVMFIKFDQLKQKDSVIPVNNAFLLEV